jgi:hypothetical protein
MKASVTPRPLYSRILSIDFGEVWSALLKAKGPLSLRRIEPRLLLVFPENRGSCKSRQNIEERAQRLAIANTVMNFIKVKLFLRLII